jgi:hypothetical protein
VDCAVNRKYFITRQLSVIIHVEKFVNGNIGPRSHVRHFLTLFKLFQIGEMDQCPLGDELLELVIREEDLINRNVRASNLNNLRKRIVSKFMQLIRSPDHNPEIIRYEKVKFFWIRTVKIQSLPVISYVVVNLDFWN